MEEEPIRDLPGENMSEDYESATGGDTVHGDQEMYDQQQQQDQSYDEEDDKEPVFCPPIKWKKVNGSQGPNPRPRHGHRAVAIRDLILVFGGGNEGIVDELHVFNTTTNQWFVPHVRGDIPSGAAAFGFGVNGTSLFIFGGMVEFGKYSNDLYELQASRWEWRKLRPRPKPPANHAPIARLGHSFVVTKGSIGYIFGGLTNDSADPKMNEPRYMNDLWLIDLKPQISNQFWEHLQPVGPSPCPRESHTACILETPTRREMIVYGGMNGARLGDIWILDLNKLVWSNIATGGVPPLPRSLHTANIVGERMYVYGGWVPLTMDSVEDGEQDREWKCTNTLGVLNVNIWNWENTGMSYYDSNQIETFPRARAGHASVVVHNRIYIWSGRDGYRKAWNNQVCCRDMWFLETERPGKTNKVQLIRAQVNQLEVSWAAVTIAEAYLIQVSKIDPEKEALKKELRPHSSPMVKGAFAGQPHVIRVVKQHGPGGIAGARATPGTKAIIISKNASGTPGQKVVILNPGAAGESASSSLTTQAQGSYAASSSQNDESSLPQNFIDGGSDEQQEAPSESKSNTQEDHGSAGDTSMSSADEPTDTNAEDVWYDVGIVKGTSLPVSHYFLPGECSLESQYGAEYDSNGIHAGEEGYSRKEELLPGVTYKFRIAGLNSIGRGAWSDEVLFKTCLPGFPGAPSSIKITKNESGANITWEPPQNTAGRISEYSVYLAVRNNASEAQLGFTRVYTGLMPECVIQQSVLNTAHMEGGQKPAIIFRIAAKNEKGYGPATQVRWLQDNRTGHTGQAPARPPPTAPSFLPHGQNQAHPFHPHGQNHPSNAHHGVLHPVQHNAQQLHHGQENQGPPMRHPQVMYTNQRVRYQPYTTYQSQNQPSNHPGPHHRM